MSGDRLTAPGRLPRAALVLVITLVFAGLVLAVADLPPRATGLSEAAHAALADTGVRNPVTATLLNYRSYDTLLEIAVLLLAVTAIRALHRGELAGMRPSGEIPASLSHVLTPVMILIAGYLLWSGSNAPGGAFQAGAILAATGVLLILTGRRLPPLRDPLPIRVGLTVGLAAFVAAGLAGMLVAESFFDYPTRNATGLVLFLEVCASVSVALALLEMFLSVLNSADVANATPATRRPKQ